MNNTAKKIIGWSIIIPIVMIFIFVTIQGIIDLGWYYILGLLGSLVFCAIFLVGIVLVSDDENE